MSKIINFPTGVTLTRAECECGQTLEYWYADDSAYGVCPKCDLKQPEKIIVKMENQPCH